MTLQKWKQYFYLYPELERFQDIRVRGSGKMLPEDDEFTAEWNNLRASSVDTMLKNLESAQTFSEFQLCVQRLSKIVKDSRILWNILHTEVQATALKVTSKQSHELATKFFTPVMLFEYGIDSFLHSELCNFSKVQTEDDVIDIFYAAAGYIRICKLPNNYKITNTNFITFVSRILTTFVRLSEFDAEHFVWLSESIHEHYPLDPPNYTSIFSDTISEYTNSKVVDSSLHKLQKLRIISTSPLFHDLPILKEKVNEFFNLALNDLHNFLFKYIFGCFVHISWDSEETEGCISEPLESWKLFLINFSNKAKQHSEIPIELIKDFIKYSLSYFVGYYGEVQASKGRAVDLRRDIFQVVDLCTKYFPGKLGRGSLEKIWYLLYIVAVSGAEDDMLNNVKQEDFAESDQPYLGLKHNDEDFSDYKMALTRLSKKFESEFEAFPAMVEFVRKNYA
ncbi:hypothetical protein GPJ56_009573 [Histomonas meleagridis]|uniref:uncharacterized protein n=1 Tax=Histomonas meleagridis TaxID=135588 RepID=UPI00355A818E|nr:hypothetical protein GPJ56_009573 [Histomonas meleagridis]KAH0799661.1 hypothetical protein GO595_007575 [Histomonas meleagridis]